MVAIPIVTVRRNGVVVDVNLGDVLPTDEVMPEGQPSAPAPAPAPEEEASVEGAVDITDMSAPQAIEVVKATDADHVLEAFGVAEGSGKARKTVLAAIKERRKALKG